ncbi:unnamed protein product, partial [Vitis vinifera]
MNQYHIYEAIGRGKYSTVYKGRKKKSIEYFAIKSVDKSQKNKLLQEVRILHSLDHSNVLNFFSWYETSAHLWLVLEYCVGGDLMTLLQQDSQLPEDSVHDLARDLVRALQFLHSKGIIYCDLKPSNILLDENGCTKLCDFGLARKLSDISKTPSSMLPQAKRGTPCYMAPELFQDGGVHSYASDFWALGCVLYECYAGRPPFVGREFTQLVKSILSDPTPTLPGTPSRPFVNLINSLLVKDPAERIQWPELCGHAFWRTKFTSVPLPPQPAFDNLIDLYSKLCGRRAQTKASGRVADEKQKDPSSATGGVNLLRLSRIAKSNLQRENEKENYRRPLPNNSENDSEHQGKVEEMEDNTNQLDTAHVVSIPVSDDSRTFDHESDHVEVAATPPSVSPQVRIQRVKEGSADKLPETLPSLPFDALAASDFIKMSKEQLDSLNNRIITIFNGNTTIAEKQNVIKYLEMLSNNADAANILTNGPIMMVIVKMLRQSKASALRVQLASLIGLLIRHSTFIDDDLASSGILGSLTDGLRDRQEKVRRFSMAALGELLFYISTQNEHAKDNNPPESPSKDSRSSSGWQVSNALISLVSSILRKGEDDVTQQYALRTIENICSQGGNWAARFTSQDVINNLCYIFRAAGKQESMRLTAGSCSPREQQISLNLLNMAMLGSHMFTNIGRHLLPLPSFVRMCLDAFLHVVSSTIPGLLETITGDIQQMMGGRRHGQIAGLTNRAAPKIKVHLFPVVLHLLGSSSFKHRVVNHQVLQQLANLIKLAESPFQGRDDFQITLLRVLESITEEPSVILESANVFIGEILPSLAVLYRGNKDGDARFLCLKILFDAMVIYLNEPSEVEQRSEDLKSISNTHFLPLYPTLIEDEDPIPMYAQKLLVMFIEFNYIRIPDILHMETLLSQLKVVRKIGNLLEFVNAKDMEDFLEPTLGLCRAFLLRSVGSRKGFIYSKEPTLICDGPTEVRGAVDQQQYIRDIMDFGSNVSVFLELSGSDEANVADIASECVVLLLKAAPREATTGFLTNLSKVSALLESWRRAVSHLLVLRMLHALGYSCRQYLSHAMILSISIPEISRLETIVSELKNSSIPGVADAALLVAKELQRLPRCN